MVGATATATEMQNNFENPTVSYLTDSLTGILKGNADLKQAKAEQLEEKAEK